MMKELDFPPHVAGYLGKSCMCDLCYEWRTSRPLRPGDLVVAIAHPDAFVERFISMTDWWSLDGSWGPSIVSPGEVHTVIMNEVAEPNSSYTVMLVSSRGTVGITRARWLITLDL